MFVYVKELVTERMGRRTERLACTQSTATVDSYTRSN
jgi:hypothetical protein